MQLTLHTDYAMRVLLYVAHFPDRRVNTREISEAFGISKNHLVRVVQTLADAKLLVATPGRNGGIALGREAGKIGLGEVVRACEPNLNVVECFEAETNSCPIVPVCGLKGPLKRAMHAFLAELDRYTLEDAVNKAGAAKFSKFLVKIAVASPVT